MYNMRIALYIALGVFAFSAFMMYRLNSQLKNEKCCGYMDLNKKDIHNNKWEQRCDAKWNKGDNSSMNNTSSLSGFSINSKNDLTSDPETSPEKFCGCPKIVKVGGVVDGSNMTLKSKRSPLEEKNEYMWIDRENDMKTCAGISGSTKTVPLATAEDKDATLLWTQLDPNNNAHRQAAEKAQDFPCKAILISEVSCYSMCDAAYKGERLCTKVKSNKSMANGFLLLSLAYIVFYGIYVQCQKEKNMEKTNHYGAEMNKKKQQMVNSSRRYNDMMAMSYAQQPQYNGAPATYYNNAYYNNYYPSYDNSSSAIASYY